MKRIICLSYVLLLCLLTSVSEASEVHVACDCDATSQCGNCNGGGNGCDTATASNGCDLLACDSLACDSLACDKSCGGTACGGECATCDGMGGCGGGCCLCKPRLFGLFAPSDHRFDNFISPMTNPVFFEDPRTLTEARFIFFNHVIPLTAGGGKAQLIAMQLRAALTDRLSIVAAKDGFITTTHPIVDDGWADVYVGLKYNLWADPCAQRLLSIGASYELPIGSSSAFQANGDGEFHLYLTGGTQIGAKSHWLSAGGVRLPVDRNDNSQSFYWSNHVDPNVAENSRGECLEDLHHPVLEVLASTKC
jgi:hypothetical protein